MKPTRRMKNLYISLAAICAVLLAGYFIASRLETVEQHYSVGSSAVTSSAEGQIRVILSISCAEAIDKSQLNEQLRETLPSDGVILSATEIVVSKGASVFDLLTQAARTYKLQLEYEGDVSSIFDSVYIEGIEHLYEFDVGPQSGWVYTVNGQNISTGCNLYHLQDGDTVAWNYTVTGLPNAVDT